MPGVLLTVAYDGANYAGFVPQKNAIAVGDVLLKAIHQIDPLVSKLHCASRTDAGVHAWDQKVVFQTEKEIPPRAWVKALTPKLPGAIVIRSAAIVSIDYIPRLHCTGKEYHYFIYRGWTRDPFFARRAWFVPKLQSESLNRIQQELSQTLGTHDFRAFRSSADQRNNTIRTIHKVECSQDPLNSFLFRIRIAGTAFMHNMVRILIGTGVDVALGRIQEGAILRAFASGDRRDLGITAPADGLYLHRVTLDDTGTDIWPPDQFVFPTTPRITVG